MAHHEIDTKEESSEEQIETIVVNVDDFIEALRFKNEPESLKNQRTVSIRIHPPFTPVVEASVDYIEKGNYYPPEMNPKPIHIDPTRFTEGERIGFPVRSLERDRAQTELDSPSDDEIEKYLEMAFDVWEDDVRSRLADELEESDNKYEYFTETVAIEWEDT